MGGRRGLKHVRESEKKKEEWNKKQTRSRFSKLQAENTPYFKSSLFSEAQ